MSLIEIKDLNKVFEIGGNKDNLLALQEISLSIEEGEFVVFLGPSGCGKSTLLRIIAGLEVPTSGSLVFDGEPVVGPSRERGMVFQAYTSFPWLTVFRNVEFGLKHGGMPKEERRSLVRRHIDMVGLHGFENAYPRELSGGMKQRLAIARSLAMEPRMLLMDEPFGALDAQVRQSLQEELLSIQRETQKTILFVTHDIDEALLLGNRILVFSSLPGKIIHEEKRPARRKLSREYFFTDEFVADKRRFAQLIEHKRFRMALSEWEGHAPIYYAREEGFIPPQIHIATGISSRQRKAGLQSGLYDCIGITLNALLEIIPLRLGKTVLSTIGSTGVGTDVLVVRREKVESIPDLTTARLGFIPFSLEHLIFALIFDKHDLDMAALRANQERNASTKWRNYADLLLKKEIDAAILCEPAITRLFTSTVTDGFRILETDVDQALVHQVVFASESVLHNKRDLLLSYLRFVLESNSLLMQYEREALSLLHRRMRSNEQFSSFVKSPSVPYYLFENILYYDLDKNIHFYKKGAIFDRLLELSQIAFRAGVLAEAIPEDMIRQSVEASFVETLAGEDS